MKLEDCKMGLLVSFIGSEASVFEIAAINTRKRKYPIFVKSVPRPYLKGYWVNPSKLTEAR